MKMITSVRKNHAIHRCYLTLLQIVVVVCLISACDQTPTVSMVGSSPVPERAFDPQILQKGRTMYDAHCVECHGADASGHPNWRKPNAQGQYPAPPLNGSGHTWHHSKLILANVIKNGSIDGKGNMPAWGAVLSDDDIQDMIIWIQSLWSDEVYAAWYEMQANGSR